MSTSAASAVGVPGFANRLGLEHTQHVIVCLVDGLGWQLVDAHRELAPHLSALDGGAVEAVFPSTTPVGLATLGTGLLPGTHGLVGATFEYPETGEVLSPLQWGGYPTPVAVQPEPTVFEKVARAGVRMTSVSPGAYRESGLTRAVLRGAEYIAADDLEERIAGVAATLATDERSYTYVYWAEVDRIGHEFGVASDEWRAALGRADQFVGRLVDAMVPGTTLVVTADHGMIDCPAEGRIDLDALPALRAGVRRVAGEPRARHVYCEDGAAADVRDTWSEVLGDRARVLARKDLVESGYFGDVDPALADRIGDVMALPRENVLLASSVDPTVSQLIGQHGGLTDLEMLIPALIRVEA